MQLNSIKPAEGSKKARRRVGRGIGSGLGKTAGRGHKGQKSRAGGFHKVGFEGGQMPLQRRLPKRGFKSKLKAYAAEVTLGELERLGKDEVDLLTLKAAGLVREMVKTVKVIKSGELKRKVSLKGIGATAGAKSAIEAAGGKVHMPAMDLEGVGRIALVADPQGVPFYVMRGQGEEASPSFDPMKPGHCHWNELSTPDQAGALAFYTARFGWQPGEVMPMGEMGGYQFLHHGGGMIGAIMTTPPGRPPGWNFAFGVRDVDSAAAKIAAGGGIVHHGPIEVPGGDWVVMASDPQGGAFMAVGPRR